MFKLTTPGIAPTTLDTANVVVDAIQSALISQNVAVNGVSASIDRRLDGKHEVSIRVDGINGIYAVLNVPIESPIIVTTEVTPID